MTEETFEQYANGEKIFENAIPAKDFVNMLKSTTEQANWTGTKTRPITVKPRGCVTLPVIFDVNNFKNLDYDAEPINDFKKLIDDYGKWLVNDVNYYNTYNYGSSAEDYIEYDVIELTNPRGDASESAEVVLFSCGMSLSPEGEYTSHMIVVFENDDDLNEFLLNEYTIVTGEFKFNGVNYSFDISGEISSDILQIFVTSDDFKEQYSDEFSTDTTDKKDIIDSVNDFMNYECDTDNKKLTNAKIKFICELTD